MEIKVDKEFEEICHQILERNLSLEEWQKKESDDEFQTKHYVGGFDSTEDAFSFSYYDNAGEEYWFQLTLDDIKKISKSDVQYIEVRRAD